MDLNSLPLPSLYTHLASTGLIHRLLELARDEDLGPPDSLSHGDITSIASIPTNSTTTLAITARTPCIIAGLSAMPDLLALFAPNATFTPALTDASAASRGSILGHLAGPQRELLALERPMLNLLSRLSGIATRTAAHVAAIPPGSRARLYDTRKTTPGLRVLEKYAVRCGGGFCHRLALHDAVLLKDNHLAGVPPDRLADFVRAAAQRARAARPDLWFIQVEVDSLEQLHRILPIAPGLIDSILLDNMTTANLQSAVDMRGSLAPSVALEASGNVTLETIPDIARTGIDRISSGSITHHAVWVDIALDAA